MRGRRRFESGNGDSGRSVPGEGQHYAEAPRRASEGARSSRHHSLLRHFRWRPGSSPRLSCSRACAPSVRSVGVCVCVGRGAWGVVEPMRAGRSESCTGVWCRLRGAIMLCVHIWCAFKRSVYGVWLASDGFAPRVWPAVVGQNRCLLSAGEMRWRGPACLAHWLEQPSATLVASFDQPKGHRFQKKKKSLPNLFLYYQI
jgi:hypothetical protein